ncbi:diacylglycerol kinase family lipid kinase [Bacillus sp. FJAT-49732]|uniref:Diacylglycerol kinase family lipid kinase n=1 Tax=Lederbergia citrisecunda TaxID=2833583 RepID=A0A942TNN7_9BACI|nr:diacylglycerol kinase family protein [Lederbergia citrisecunda]MBS4200052.1 diacylglycerol kinase family lipid kinase [Lederbergia citrisecunda]
MTLNDKRKLIFIINPAAKNGYSLRIWKKLSRQLQDIPYEVFFTEKTNDGANIAKKLAMKDSHPLLIVAVGGDGTIHEVINGIMQFPHVTIAYIPAGSGNDFARGFSLPTDPMKSIEFIEELMDFPATLFDAGTYTTNQGERGFFVNSIGAGFDALISMRGNRSKAKKWLNSISLGKLVYSYYVIKELFCYRPTTLTLEVDGKKRIYDKTWFVTISNQQYFGGGMKIAPHADPRDGEFNITVVHRLSKIKLLFIFMSVFWGGHLKYKEVDSYNGREISIYFEQPVRVHADGEDISETPFYVKILPKSWGLIQK